MSIDWITVAAQLTNFLILVGLLKRFLYRPILDGIDAREREITERLSQAQGAVERAHHAQTEHQKETERLRKARSSVLDDAHRAAEADRNALLALTQAQIEREQLVERERRTLESVRYTSELQQAGAHALLSLTRKALLDLSDETLEQRIVRNALARPKELAAALGRAVTDGGELIISTREPINRATREQLIAELLPQFPGVTPRVRSEPEQAPGLVLQLGGVRVSWTTDSYIDELQALLPTPIDSRAPSAHDAP